MPYVKWVTKRRQIFADPRRGSGIVMSLRGPGLAYQSAYPRKRTLAARKSMSAMGHKRTLE